MEFVAVTFNSTPVVRFAHLYESKQSSWEIFEHNTLMEITAVEKGSLIMKDNKTGQKHVFNEGSV